MIAKTLINGQYSESISVYDRGLSYGDGLFETIKISSAGPQLLEQHLQRLFIGCEKLAINCDAEQLNKEISQLLSEQLPSFPRSDAVLKITVTRGTGARGYACDPQHESTRILSLSGAINLQSGRQGIRATVCQTRLSANPALAGIKHLCRLENVLARAEWTDAKISEGILLSTDNRVIEGTMSNLFFIRDGVLHTPDLSTTGIKGIVRDVILNVIAPELGLKTRQGDYCLDDLYQADGVFITNSLIGLWPVLSIDDRIFKNIKMTQRIQNSLDDALND